VSANSSAGASIRSVLLTGRKTLGKMLPASLRCLGQCKPFGADCGGHQDCITDMCYKGKCGYDTKCRAAHETCYQYAPHVCCSGECEPVGLQNDCIRMLGVPMDVSKRDPGRNMDRECEFIGSCKAWPGQPMPPGPQSTPWAVPPNDYANKYYDLAGVTFSEDAKVETADFIARKGGQIYENVAADVTKPGGMRDAGVVVFDADSAVKPEWWASYVEGIMTYCIAPILKGGNGGGFYAVGKDCCTKEEGFTCAVGGLPKDVKAGVVLAQQTEKYANALQVLENQHGKEFHGDAFGVTTLLPLYLHMVVNYQKQLEAPPLDFVYVAPLKTTYCVAPILSKSGKVKKADQINFWAVGIDCCDIKTGFHCGDVADPEARSGVTDNDDSGEYRLAIQMAEIKYSIKSLPRPMYFHWTKETLVADPRGR